LKALKTDPATQAITAVVLTGSDLESDISECYRLGADAYLVKPMHFEALVEIVAAIDRHWLTGTPLPARTPPDRIPKDAQHAA